MAHSLLGEGLDLRLTLSGNAMMPWLPDGTVVRVAPIPPEGLRQFDVVVVETESGRFSARRVIQVSENHIQTKGDSRHLPEPPHATSDIIGRVTRAEAPVWLRMDTRVSRLLGRMSSLLYPYFSTEATHEPEIGPGFKH